MRVCVCVRACFSLCMVVCVRVRDCNWEGGQGGVSERGGGGQQISKMQTEMIDSTVSRMSILNGNVSIVNGFVDRSSGGGRTFVRRISMQFVVR